MKQRVIKKQQFENITICDLIVLNGKGEEVFKSDLVILTPNFEFDKMDIKTKFKSLIGGTFCDFEALNACSRGRKSDTFAFILGEIKNRELINSEKTHDKWHEIRDIEMHCEENIWTFEDYENNKFSRLTY